MKTDFSITEQSSYQESIKKVVDNLQPLLGFSDKVHFEINLILDEICTNIFVHNSIKPKISITIEDVNNSIRITIVDNGMPFDPTSTITPETNLPLEKREPGGLGILLVKKFSSYLSYVREKSTNKTIIEKTI